MYTSLSKNLQPSDFRPIKAADYIRAFVWEARCTKGRILRARNRVEAEDMKNYINDSRNATGKPLRDLKHDICYWHKQEVDFTPSNLGKGFVWHFTCGGCNRRARHLYEYDPAETSLCRECCKIPYSQPTRKERKISKMIRMPYYTPDMKRRVIRLMEITEEDLVAARAIQ